MCTSAWTSARRRKSWREPRRGVARARATFNVKRWKSNASRRDFDRDDGASSISQDYWRTTTGTASAGPPVFVRGPKLLILRAPSNSRARRLPIATPLFTNHPNHPNFLCFSSPRPLLPSSVVVVVGGGGGGDFVVGAAVFSSRDSNTSMYGAYIGRVIASVTNTTHINTMHNLARRVPLRCSSSCFSSLNPCDAYDACTCSGG